MKQNGVVCQPRPALLFFLFRFENLISGPKSYRDFREKGPRPENMEGRSPCRENNDSLPIQIPRCDTHFGQFKEEKLMQLCFFFFWRATEISFVTNILAAGGLGSHVTITFRDKSRYDLIVFFL